MPEMTFFVFMQLFVNSIIAACIYYLVASGFSLVYSVNKFQNFAHGSMVAFSSYMMFLYFSRLKISFIISAVLAILCSALLGYAINYLVFRQLRKRNAGSTIMLISSLAILTIINASLLLFFSSDVKTIKVPNPIFFPLGVRLSAVQLSIIGIAAIVMSLLWYVSFRTKLGKAMRALSDNKEVAQTIGINPERIYSATMLISSALAGIAGILIGIEFNLYPQMGFMLIVKGFAASVIGGFGLLHGTIYGSLILGFAENFGVWYLPSGYKDAIAFFLMFIFLLIRPYGIFGRKKREDIQ